MKDLPASFSFLGRSDLALFLTDPVSFTLLTILATLG